MIEFYVRILPKQQQQYVTEKIKQQQISRRLAIVQIERESKKEPPINRHGRGLQKLLMFKHQSYFKPNQ